MAAINVEGEWVLIRCITLGAADGFLEGRRGTAVVAVDSLDQTIGSLVERLSDTIGWRTEVASPDTLICRKVSRSGVGSCAIVASTVHGVCQLVAVVHRSTVESVGGDVTLHTRATANVSLLGGVGAVGSRIQVLKDSVAHFVERFPCVKGGVARIDSQETLVQFYFSSDGSIAFAVGVVTVK